MGKKGHRFKLLNVKTATKLCMPKQPIFFFFLSFGQWCRWHIAQTRSHVPFIAMLKTSTLKTKPDGDFFFFNSYLQWNICHCTVLLIQLIICFKPYNHWFPDNPKKILVKVATEWKTSKVSYSIIKEYHTYSIYMLLLSGKLWYPAR